jgi:hypothetical protein
MSSRAAAWLAWSLLALYVLSASSGSVLYVLNGSSERTLYGDIANAAAYAAFAAVGFLIARRKPGNAIGWLFGGIALSSSLSFLAGEYSKHALITNPGSLPGGLFVAWVSNWSWVPAVMLPATFLPLLFPTGEPLSRRWRPIAWLAAIVMAAFILLGAILPGPLSGEFRSIANPAGVEALKGVEGPALTVLGTLLTGVLLVSVVSLIVRFWRSEGEERQQIKWFAYAAMLLIGLSFLNGPFGGPGNLFFGVGIALLPIATGIAILRYRLYDIDLIINRTLVYGSLTATLVAFYLGGIVVLQRLFVYLTGEKSTLAVVASTLAIAALFNPLRRRVQGFVDHRFYRRKYDAAKTLAAFNTRLRDETELDTLSGDVVGVVRETMQPAHVSLWLRPPTGLDKVRGEGPEQ